MVGVRLFCFWFVREKILRLSFHLAGSEIGIVLGLDYLLSYKYIPGICILFCVGFLMGCL